MKHPGPNQRGYSLIELLMVLVILSILSIAGVVYLGNRPSTGVRAILDELEGSLVEAQRLAIATGRDVTLATDGNWTAATPAVLVRGDSTILAAEWANILAAAQGTWPPAKGTMNDTQLNSLGIAFRLGTSSNGALTREHMNAAIAIDPAWWGTAQGDNEDINKVTPFLATTGFNGQLVDANLLFKNAADTTLSLSGTSKRFNQTLWIPVVGLSAGLPVPGGPMGVIFVQASGGSIYKFYNPGTRQGDGKWRRI